MVEVRLHRFEEQNPLKVTYERGIKNKATISMNFSMNTFACFSASLKGIMRTFKRWMSAVRIGNEYSRSFLVFMWMLIFLWAMHGHVKLRLKKLPGLKLVLFELSRSLGQSTGLAICNETEAWANKTNCHLAKFKLIVTCNDTVIPFHLDLFEDIDHGKYYK